MLSILSAHNHYRQAGGEDQIFANEAALLEQNGHEVVQYAEDNVRIQKGSLGAACGTVWSAPSFRRLSALARSRPFDIAHFHNTFPLISPAGYYAVRRARLPVVQTLHNYRLLCPAFTLMRNGVACEQCLGRLSVLPSVLHGCYRNSRPATAAVAAMLVTH